MSERAACRVTGQARSTQRRTPKSDRLNDPDRSLRDWLNAWANTEGNARKGYRRAWADLCHEGHRVNKKKVHRLWRQEGLQVAQRQRRKRVGVSSGPILDADAPNVVWAIDFQFDSLHDGRRSRSRQPLTSTPANRSLTSPPGRSPAKMSWLLWERSSQAVNGPKQSAATTDPNWFPTHSRPFVRTRSTSDTSRPVNHGVTASSSRSTGGSARNV